jgi:hypothetical protein
VQVALFGLSQYGLYTSKYKWSASNAKMRPSQRLMRKRGFRVELDGLSVKQLEQVTVAGKGHRSFFSAYMQ